MRAIVENDLQQSSMQKNMGLWVVLKVGAIFSHRSSAPDPRVLCTPAPLGPVPVSQPPRPLESVRRAHWALTVGVSPTLAGGCGAVWFGQQACTWGHIDLSGKLLCSSNWTGKRCFKWKLWNRLGYEMTFFPVTVLFFNSSIEVL